MITASNALRDPRLKDIDSRRCLSLCTRTMGKGGRGKRDVLDRVLRLRAIGTEEAGIRTLLRGEGFHKTRICELLKATRSGASTSQATPGRQAAARAASSSAGAPAEDLAPNISDDAAELPPDDSFRVVEMDDLYNPRRSRSISRPSGRVAGVKTTEEKTDNPLQLAPNISDDAAERPPNVRFRVMEMDDLYHFRRSRTISRPSGRVADVATEKKTDSPLPQPRRRRELGQPEPWARPLRPRPAVPIDLAGDDLVDDDDGDDELTEVEAGTTPWPDPTGMRICPIGRDGNCQFRAVALAEMGDERHHMALRRAAVEEITGEEAAHYVPFIDEDMSVATWRGEMLRSGTYGDHITLHAMAQVLRRPIVVWREGHWRQPAETCSVRSVSVDVDRRDPDIVYLLHRDVAVGDEGHTAKHYDLLIPLRTLDEEAPPAPEERDDRRGRGRHRRRKGVFAEDRYPDTYRSNMYIRILHRFPSSQYSTRVSFLGRGLRCHVASVRRRAGETTRPSTRAGTTTTTSQASLRRGPIQIDYVYPCSVSHMPRTVYT